jgi:hypothetical protein
MAHRIIFEALADEGQRRCVDLSPLWPIPGGTVEQLIGCMHVLQSITAHCTCVKLPKLL